MNTIENHDPQPHNVLVTGGLGFIGFNAIQLWTELRHYWKIYVVDKETYAAQFKLKEKKDWCAKHNVDVFNVDIADPNTVDCSEDDKKMHVNQLDEIVRKCKIDIIINFAAESHVDNSISGPDVFFKTNIIGTANLLEVARKYNVQFHQISTDEVYGITSPEDMYDNFKLDVLNPSSPYSSSKASADLLTMAYYRTYGLKATISRCSNNFGPWQHPEKLIPKICECLKTQKQIPVYGNGEQKRQWVSVRQHNLSVLDIIEHGNFGQIYNISSDKYGYMTNVDLIHKFCEFANADPDKMIKHVEDRLGHDTSYFIYNYFYLMPNEYGDEIIMQDFKKTFEWYKENL